MSHDVCQRLWPANALGQLRAGTGGRKVLPEPALETSRELNTIVDERMHLAPPVDHAVLMEMFVDCLNGHD